MPWCQCWPVASVPRGFENHAVVGHDGGLYSRGPTCLRRARYPGVTSAPELLLSPTPRAAVRSRPCALGSTGWVWGGVYGLFSCLFCHRQLQLGDHTRCPGLRATLNLPHVDALSHWGVPCLVLEMVPCVLNLADFSGDCSRGHGISLLLVGLEKVCHDLADVLSFPQPGHEAVRPFSGSVLWMGQAARPE